MKLSVSAFYKFVALPEFASLRPALLEAARARGICGTILLAPEGINGTIAGEPERLAEMMAFIRGIENFADLESKESWADETPFRRMKVRLKREIVTMGVPGLDPAHSVGTYVSPESWNALIANPDVLVIDTRNSFEFAAGTFRNAVDPRTRSFGEFQIRSTGPSRCSAPAASAARRRRATCASRASRRSTTSRAAF